MTQVLLAFAVTFVAALGIERLAKGLGPEWPAPAALPARLLATGLLYALALGIFDRAWLAASASLITLGIFVAISRRKRHLVGEPLVFSDFGLIRLIIRHPDLYYTDVLTSWPALLGGAVLVGATGSWLWLEPPVLAGRAVLLLLAGWFAGVALLWWAAWRPPLSTWLRAAIPEPDLERHLRGWGLLLTLLAYTLRWRAELALPFPVSEALHPPEAVGSEAADVVVVVQLESFMDPSARLDESTPPGLAAARANALLHGRLRVPAHGAYTMRSEFAVLSGLSERALGFRRFDPYLTTAMRGAVAAPNLASRLRQAGYHTLFIHPFRAGFFDREAAMARLGFERCLWDDDLADAERRGPYVADPALAARLLAEIKAAQAGDPGRRVFAMAVTMENHGPWPPGRLPGDLDSRGQYLEHLASTDRAITLLIDGLRDHPGRVLLCLYGDHPPILPCLDSAMIPETDYVVLELGRRGIGGRAGARALTADELGRVIMSRAVPAGSGEAPTA